MSALRHLGLAALLGLAACTSTRGEVEQRLGTPIPAAAQHLELHRTRPGKDGGFTTYYARFDIDISAWPAFLLAAKLDPKSRLLPATTWSGPSARALEWWRPHGTSPSASGARELPPNGFILAKWEEGHGYVVVVDPGPDNNTPGPY